MLQIICGYLVDLLVGDPYWLFHPVRWIGSLVGKLESKMNQGQRKRLKGIAMSIIVMVIAFAVPYGLLKLTGHFNRHVMMGLEAFMIFQIMATRSLDFETQKVYRALKQGNLPEARLAVSYLVSRDTDEMTEEEIIKAGIETISENLADGVVAPLLFIMLGGAPLGWLYKSVNTMDSMVGYKNERYAAFGWASAKIDDLLNYIPARLSAVFILIAGFILRMDLANGLRILKRDKRNHSSPNSAYPESAAAGLLGIELGGKATYFGQTSVKPTMGDAKEQIAIDHLLKTRLLLYGTSLTAFISFLLIRWGIQ